MTANPTIFAKAIEGSDAYDEQFAALIAQGRPVLDVYDLVDDIGDASGVLRPTFDASAGTDGFVPVEVAPGTGPRHRRHHRRRSPVYQWINQPNLFVKIPASGEGVPAGPGDDRRGTCSINITLIFPARYAEVIDATSLGSRPWPREAGNLGVGAQRGVVLRQSGRHRGRPSPGRHRHRRRAGPAGARPRRPGQAGLPAVPGPLQRPRWEALAARGAQVQRPLGRRRRPRTLLPRHPVCRQPHRARHGQHSRLEATIAAFEDRGTLARTIDSGVDHAEAVMDRLAEVGVDMADLGHTLEDQGVASFTSCPPIAQALEHKAAQLAPR